MSRARWVAFGSTLTLMSCNDGTSTPSSTMDAAGTMDVTGLDGARSDALIGAETSVDAAGDSVDVATDGKDAGVEDSSDDPASDATDDSVRTDASPDHIDTDAPADGGDANLDVSLDGGSKDADATADGAYFWCCGSPPAQCANCDRRTQICDLTSIPFPAPSPCYTLDGGTLGNFPEQCAPEGTCACINRFFLGCQGTSSSTYGCSDDAGAVTVSCNGCYGSPPMRWERWSETVRDAIA